jgi:NAD(P)-dependent dehydrogenase (short-subunit alcohol dehydrogenase family)
MAKTSPAHWAKTAARNIALTGVSRGLGLAMAEGFIAAGHTVFGAARDEKKLAELRVRWPAPHRFDAVDVADDAAVARWAASVLAAAGHVDLVINNAALMNEPAPLWKVPADEFSRLVDVNIKGPANVIRHFVPAMVQRGSGVIVNFSSGWGRSVSADVAPYCASKWGIEGLTLALAEDLPDSMAAVALNPGVIDTDMLRVAWGDEAASYQNPESWAKNAVPLILGLAAKDNGKQLAVRSH